MEELARELPKLDPFEGFSEGAIWLARFLARVSEKNLVKIIGFNHPLTI